jgi:hypothetical protein
MSSKNILTWASSRHIPVAAPAFVSGHARMPVRGHGKSITFMCMKVSSQEDILNDSNNSSFTYFAIEKSVLCRS